MGHVKALVAGACFALALAGSGCGESPGENSGNIITPTAGMGAGIGGASGAGQAGTAGVDGSINHGAMPCEIETAVKQHCGNCHGTSPNFGAPMALATLADFQRDYAVASTPQLANQTLKMYELARIRLNAEMGTSRMPQSAVPLEANTLSMLNTWLMSGAPSGNACAAPTGGTGGASGQGGVGGTLPPAGAGGAGGDAGGTTGGTGGITGKPAIEDQCTQPGAFDPLTPKEEGEMCFNFLVHGANGVNDTSPFNVITGESYNQFYYEVPWPAGWVATRFGQDFDNTKVLHHWLMFAQQFGQAPGTVERNVPGTTLFTDAELIAGWAVGGCTTTYPSDVGVHLPSTGVIMVQWHHYNNTMSPQNDNSSVQICAVPESQRTHKAGLTFLGTENLSVPAGMMGKAEGTCVNDSGAPITIVGFTPHMHEIGIHMQSEVMRMGGSTWENVFDMPFQFDYQTNYMMNPPVVLMPGESIKSTCTWENKSFSTVNFGQSTKAEMCYQFALAYPYGALNNGVISLIGATNTCW